MKINRWNYESRKYIPTEINEDWNCKTYSEDMKELVNCPCCGKELEFGKTYCSRDWHTELGLGYGVCSKCYKEETRRITESIRNY